MHIIYRITYIPHVKNKTPPYYYIGSKYNYNGGYFGSPSSKQKSWYSEDLSISQWWKNKTKSNPDDFIFEILEELDNVSTKELVEIEKTIHLSFNVRVSEEFFNASIATTGWASVKKTKQTRSIMSAKTKEYWTSQGGLEKKKRLIERNKTEHKNTMLKKWKTPSEAMKNMPRPGGVNRGKDKHKRKEKKNIRLIYADGLIFNNAKLAAEYFKIDPINIRRRCRLQYKGTWRYIDENLSNN